MGERLLLPAGHMLMLPSVGMSTEITLLLKAATEGDPQAVDDLFQVVYGELRTIAHSHRRRWVGDATLNTTALIHEAYVKLAGQDQWQDRAHFFATAARAMRHILVNYAERRRAAKRGGGGHSVPLDDALLASDGAADEMIALHQALELFEAQHGRAARVLECRFFGGLSVEETAEALSISPATVKREGRFARAWLYQRLGTR